MTSISSRPALSTSFFRVPAPDAIDQLHAEDTREQQADAERAAVQRGHHAADAELVAQFAQHHTHAEPGDEEAVAECR